MVILEVKRCGRPEGVSTPSLLKYSFYWVLSICELSDIPLSAIGFHKTDPRGVYNPGIRCRDKENTFKQPHYPTARHCAVIKTNRLRFACALLTLSLTFSLSLAQRTDQPGVIQKSVDKQLICMKADLLAFTSGGIISCRMASNTTLNWWSYFFSSCSNLRASPTFEISSDPGEQMYA